MTHSTAQARPGHVVVVDSLPYCDVCGESQASWDAPTADGPWAFLCEGCARWHARYPGETGVGIGQRLVVA